MDPRVSNPTTPQIKLRKNFQPVKKRVSLMGPKGFPPPPPRPTSFGFFPPS